ncbi:hypothetical protein [Candidatus Nanohalobium constans]|uniref:DUF4298 domain-containing protein n=1 Tax=Candidatus Nanohalobium constans TaxID=2565781 RepID=A0A5Q0UHR7_9ARCH|nr:hypothetical protein [Candidatus Nanohalobium constans]QGA80891.1 hypothetical protein LC1Nh_1015 [Candidatus Nanohalobium constans]
MDDAEEMFETLEEAHEKLTELEEDRDKLLEANKKLVRILVSMENDLKDAGVDFEELDEHSYSFHEGWSSRRDGLMIEDISEESVDRQLRQLDQLLSNKDIL